MKEKILKVPLVSQPEKSLDCGPSCTAMVLKYFKKPGNRISVRKQLDYVDDGTYLTQNGAVLQRAGLKTRFVTAHPILFPHDIIRRTKTKADVLKWLRRFGDFHKKNETYQKALKHYREYLRVGGKLVLEIPSFEEHIVKTIDDGGLVIASLHGGALGRKEAYGYHFVVVDGYRKGAVHITNPWKPSHQRAWFPVERFMFAVHSNTVFDPDNGSLLLVTK